MTCTVLTLGAIIRYMDFVLGSWHLKAALCAINLPGNWHY